MMLATALLAMGLTDPQVVTDISFSKQPEPSIEAPDVFPSQERIEEKREQQGPLVVVPVQPVLGASNVVPPHWISYGNLKINSATGAVKMQMKPGRLAPQIKEIAAKLEGVNANEGGEWFVWKPSPNYRWPNSVELHEPSVKHLINALVSSAGLSSDITKNGMVIVYE